MNEGFFRNFLPKYNHKCITINTLLVLQIAWMLSMKPAWIVFRHKPTYNVHAPDSSQELLSAVGTSTIYTVRMCTGDSTWWGNQPLCVEWRGFLSVVSPYVSRGHGCVCKTLKCVYNQCLHVSISTGSLDGWRKQAWKSKGVLAITCIMLAVFSLILYEKLYSGCDWVVVVYIIEVTTAWIKQYYCVCIVVIEEPAILGAKQ